MHGLKVKEKRVKSLIVYAIFKYIVYYSKARVFVRY